MLRGKDLQAFGATGQPSASSTLTVDGGLDDQGHIAAAAVVAAVARLLEGRGCGVGISLACKYEGLMVVSAALHTE